MSDAEIAQATSQFEMMAANPELVKQATEQMKGMSAEDVQELRKCQASIFGEGDMATKQWLWGFLLLTGKAHLIICKTRKQKIQLLSSMEHLLRGGGIRPVSAPVRPLGPNK